MILLGLAAVALLQAHVVGAAWAGDWIPDPFVILLALAGLHGGGRGLVPWALALGWARALVHVEPVGVHVLCALFALWIVSGQRDAVDRTSTGALLVACLFAAGAWTLAALATGLVAGDVPGFGLALLSGALLALPVAPPVRRLVRGSRRSGFSRSATWRSASARSGSWRPGSRRSR